MAHSYKEFEEKRLALKVLQRVNPLDIRIQQGLSELPLNSSRTRIRNRCVITGRSRSIWRTFRISRIQLRKLAIDGLLVGVKKASW